MKRHEETVTDLRGNVVPGCQIRVTTLDGTLAQLWADSAGLIPLANPVIANSEGQVYFHAANGKYNIITERNGVVVDTKIDVVLFDPDDFAPLGEVDVVVFTADDLALFQGLGSIKRPPAAIEPATNGELVFELTDNTLLRIKVRGSDGVVRVAALPLF